MAESLWKQRFTKDNPWGLSSAIGIYGCDPDLIRDAGAIRRFVIELCDRIQMRRFGECHVVDFGEDDRVAGFSMFQLIETSNISAHFANASNAVYLDVFSCKAYEPDTVAVFAKEFFRGKSVTINVTPRM